MVDLTKKEKEKFYLEFLLKELGMDISNVQDSESPDFIYKDGNKLIGIEITRIFNETGDPPLQVIESHYEQIKENLEVLLNNSGLPKLDVSLTFSQMPSIIKRNRKQLAELIYEYILPIELSVLRVARFSFIDKHQVVVPKLGCVCEDFFEKLQSIIHKKNEKLLNSYKELDENWLLIYSDNDSGASMNNPSSQTLEYNYKTDFDKLFFFSGIRFQIFELNKFL